MKDIEQFTSRFHDIRVRREEGGDVTVETGVFDDNASPELRTYIRAIYLGHSPSAAADTDLRVALIGERPDGGRAEWHLSPYGYTVDAEVSDPAISLEQVLTSAQIGCVAIRAFNAIRWDYGAQVGYIVDDQSRSAQELLSHGAPEVRLFGELAMEGDDLSPDECLVLFEDVLRGVADYRLPTS